ncbi:MAG TPA: hypothetical protein VIU12_22085 [Chryseolinea sp.]
MNHRLKYLLTCTALFVSLAAFAQLPSNRIKPATMYHAGDTVRSPRLGVVTQIPQGWSGVLPRDTEVFLLMPESNTVGEIYVVVNEKMDMERQKKRWEAGTELSPGITLQPQSAITARGTDVISATGKITGANTNQQAKIYAEAKCSPLGFCITYLATSDAQHIENVKKTLQTFVDNTVFQQPSTESPYAHFNWKKFLDGKILLAMGYDANSKRIDEVDLCADGSFRSDITRTGIFKGQAKGYQGKKRGTWQVASRGEKATITFTFEKNLPDVDIELEARDEEIYIKGTRYFVGDSERCK